MDTLMRRNLILLALQVDPVRIVVGFVCCWPARRCYQNTAVAEERERDDMLDRQSHDLRVIVTQGKRK
jgi:hypothetical protein